jgi:4-amino-4-deoxy-L-arabinose transferase-like glycosyltransferase
MDLICSGSTKLTTGRWKAFLILFVAWAVIYLPGLGRQGLKGEEGRRVLPAIEMLKTGNWVVPRIADQDYYNKPPGINWLVAASFALTGEQSELTARLPSVIFVLIFVSLLIWMPSPWLNLEARIIAAIIYMTNIAIIEKGRLIEIESVYIALTGIATLLWLNLWSRQSSRWLLWMPAGIVLGFGLLVKGPFIQVFFYSVVVSVLWYEKKLKELLRIEHIAAAGVAAIMAGAWVLMAFLQTNATAMTSRMSSQLLIRIIGDLDILYWGQNVLREFEAFLPWLLFVPMLWNKSLTSRIAPQYQPLFLGSRLGMVIGFVIITLMPRMEARYTMPLIPLISVLLGWLLSLHKEVVSTDRLWKNIVLVCLLVSCLIAAAGLIFVTRSPATVATLAATIIATAFVLRKRNAIQGKLELTLATMLLVMILMLQHSTFFLDIAISRETRRPAAMAVNSIVPEGETINLFKPGSYIYPTVFRLRPPIRYILDANDVNEQVHYLLIKEDDLDGLKAEKRIASGSDEELYELPDEIPDEYRLVRLK